jgi:Zn-dependent peptidase ImmA (M78 family)
VHELAHLWLGDTGVSNLNHLAKEAPDHVNNEHYCNALTAEFLVPEYAIRNMWGDGINEGAATNFIRSAAKKFQVSEICVARRLLDLNLISSDFYWDFYKLYIARLQHRKEQQRETEGGPDPAVQNKFRLGGRLIETVIDAAQEGRISELDASQMLRVKINKFSGIYSGAV